MRKILVLKVVDKVIKVMDEDQAITALKYSSYRLLTAEEKERVVYGDKGPYLVSESYAKQIDEMFSPPVVIQRPWYRRLSRWITRKRWYDA